MYLSTVHVYLALSKSCEKTSTADSGGIRTHNLFFNLGRFPVAPCATTSWQEKWFWRESDMNLRFWSCFRRMMMVWWWDMWCTCLCFTFLQVYLAAVSGPLALWVPNSQTCIQWSGDSISHGMEATVIWQAWTDHITTIIRERPHYFMVYAKGKGHWWVVLKAVKSSAKIEEIKMFLLSAFLQ